MPYRCTKFKSPVACHNRLARYCDLKALVLKFSAIGPVLVDTRNRRREGLECQEIPRLVNIIVEIQRQTVVQHIYQQSAIPFRGCLPLDALIADGGHLSTYRLIIISHRSERSTCSIAWDIIITAEVKACIKSKVVNARIFREPVLVSHHPTQLNAWEHSPLRTEHLQCSRCLTAEPAVSLGKQRNGGEIAIAIVVVSTRIPLHILPHIISAIYIGIARSRIRRQIRILIRLSRFILRTRITTIV